MRWVAALTALAALYYALLRRPILTWGATEAEASARLAGRRAARGRRRRRHPRYLDRGPRRAVWPWLAQIGPSPRGGAYTYDWIENLLGLNMHSADHCCPSSSTPQAATRIGFGANRMRLERVEPERVLAWRSEDGNWVWSFVLDEHDGSTRLISRNRFRLPTLTRAHRDGPDGARLLVMERKMLLGIKQRAERLASP